MLLQILLFQIAMFRNKISISQNWKTQKRQENFFSCLISLAEQ